MAFIETTKTANTFMPCNGQKKAPEVQQQPRMSKSFDRGLGLRSSKRTGNATTTQISNSLKMSIAQELFDSKVAKEAASRRSTKGRDAAPAPIRKSVITMEDDSPLSTPTSSTTASSSASNMLSSCNRGSALKTMLSRKPSVKDPAVLPSLSSSEFGPDYQYALDEKSHQLPYHLRKSGAPRSCLKGSARQEPKRTPPKRSVSADQLHLQVRLPGKPKPITRTRSITFDESVRVRRVPSISQLSQGRTEEIWFQTEEYDNIKRKTYSLIRAIQQGQTGGVNYCTRGLEKYFHADKVQHRRAAAWDSVFYAQEDQRRQGSFDDLQMASAYKSWTSESGEEAASRGKLDEESVKRYVRRTQELVRSRSMPSPTMTRVA